MKGIYYLFTFFLFLSANARPVKEVNSIEKTVSFQEALERLNSHESIQAIMHLSQATKEEATLKGSWGDPHFKVAAKNFPKNSFKDDETAMTGVEIGLAQKISLTTKYGNIEKAFSSMAMAYHYDANDKKQALARGLWEILILQRKTSEELAILSDNQTWILKILKVSKRLYSTGKTSQQALLDIQIRNAEIESELNNKKYELEQIDDRLTYLIGSSKIAADTIPWTKLSHETNKLQDYRDLSLQEKLKAKELALNASRLNYIPDVTFSIGYTKRANIDGKGDFVGAAINFPLPFSAVKYSQHGKATEEKFQAHKNYENYKKQKQRDTSLLSREIEKLTSELNILNEKTLKFAKNSREITAKSYKLGNSSYVELLQSELKLQKILMNKVMLEAMRDIKRASLKYLKGEALNE